MAVLWMDHKAQYLSIKQDVDAALRRVIESGSYQRGEEVDAFEREFSEYCDVAHGICTNSCYAAMFLSLLSCEIGPGDEVITVPNTDITCTAAINHTGATPASTLMTALTTSIRNESRRRSRSTPKRSFPWICTVFRWTWPRSC